MFAVNSTTTTRHHLVTSKISDDRRFKLNSVVGDINGMSRKTYVPYSTRSSTAEMKFKRQGISVRASHSQDNAILDTSVVVPSKKVDGEKSPTSSSSSSSSSAGSGGKMEVRAVVKIRKKMKEKLLEKIADQWEFFVNGIGHGIQIKLISEQVDPDTKSGKSVSCVRGWLPGPSNSNHPQIVEYVADFTIPNDFGPPCAIVLTNLHGREFHLLEIVLHGFEGGPTFFPASTWIHSHKHNSESRVIFKNQAYLPSQTPAGIKDLRHEDLLSLRGDGKGERKPHERIYDYDLYNDLGDPDNEDLSRAVLGGEKKPFPRRCRTGRPPPKSDPQLESRVEKSSSLYVPRDETFGEIKEDTFAAGRLKSLLHNLIPLLVSTLSSSDMPFDSFSDIDNLYNDGVVLKDREDVVKFSFAKNLNFVKKIFNVGERLLKFDIPAVIRRDRFSWLRDNEFARQCLAGVNPVNIEILKEFPIVSKLDPEVYGPAESAITKELVEQELNGMSAEKAIQENRLFILDFHDMLLPLIEKINSLPDRRAYASRTVFFHTDTGVLRPIAIELSLPQSPSSSSPSKRVYTHGNDATTHWIWNLAKAHVCSNESAIHQLVNHWVRTHASTEPYIIATHRQLSSMHPIYKLLHSHMRYTLEINALARQSLVNGGGVLEVCFSPGKYAMDLSSAAYKNFWRFDKEALPADLLRRGMAVEDPSMPCGVRLVIEDYPYAADGLLVWSAIKEWVESYVSHFYSEPNSVTNDVELQAWWDEIKNKGHYDKRNEPWWPKLNTKEDLSGILTTMIWVVSGQHAAINFGQYPFGGYVPNRPTLMRKLVPQENEPEYDKFILNPQQSFLSSLPTQLVATKIMALLDSLSAHSPDEEYLGQVNSLQSFANWVNDDDDDDEVGNLFSKFSARLEEIEEIINRRNKDICLKNRNGAGVPPYELLIPSSGPGVTGRGIPNSISI